MTSSHIPRKPDTKDKRDKIHWFGPLLFPCLLRFISTVLISSCCEALSTEYNVKMDGVNSFSFKVLFISVGMTVNKTWWKMPVPYPRRREQAEYTVNSALTNLNIFHSIIINQRHPHNHFLFTEHLNPLILFSSPEVKPDLILVSRALKGFIN